MVYYDKRLKGSERLHLHIEIDNFFQNIKKNRNQNQIQIQDILVILKIFMNNQKFP